MAEKNTPNRAANREKIDGDRWRSDEDTVRNATTEQPETQYRSDLRGSGISNRPVSEEIETQGALPARGTGVTDDIVARDPQSRGNSPRRYEEEADAEEAPSRGQAAPLRGTSA